MGEQTRIRIIANNNKFSCYNKDCVYHIGGRCADSDVAEIRKNGTYKHICNDRKDPMLIALKENFENAG